MKPRDRDFIESTDGLFFCVIDYLHPSDGYTAYLKYIPSKTGKWERDGVRYTRSIPYYGVSQIENTYDWLKAEHPEYILHCPVRNIEISWVPKNKVKTYYHPQKRLNEIEANGANDILEDKLLRLTSLLEETAGLSDALGVTGSILTRTHNPEFSDIDLTVNGIPESYKLIDAIQKLKKTNMVQGITSQERGEWVQSRMGKHGLPAVTLMRIAEKRWNYGYFEGTYFSIHPTRKENEINEVYGDNTYHRIGAINGAAVVTDAEESILLPAVYKIEDEEHPLVSEIVSYEGLYGSLFKEDDEIKYSGILEEVMGKTPHQRIIIGGAGSPDSYIKWGYSG